MTNEQWLQYFAEWNADFDKLLDEIRSGTHQPDPELLKLAEAVIASQPKNQTPEQINEWAARLAADFIAADEDWP